MSGLRNISTGLLVLCFAAVPALTQKRNQPPHFAPPANRNSATNGQQRHMGDWLRKNKGLSLAQQQQALENDPEFKKLPTDRQARLRERLQEFNSMPPDQQRRVLERMDKWEHMSPEEKSQARGLMDRMRSLPEERRGMVRRAFHSLAGMTGEEREKVMSSEQFRSTFSDDERDLLQKGLDLTDKHAPVPGPEEAGPPQR